jgi:hypothetical protein
MFNEKQISVKVHVLALQDIMKQNRDKHLTIVQEARKGIGAAAG